MHIHLEYDLQGNRISEYVVKAVCLNKLFLDYTEALGYIELIALNAKL